MADTVHERFPTPKARTVGYRDERLKGIFCLCLGVAVFSLQDLVLKLLSGVYPVHQAMVVRSLTAVPVLFVFVMLEGGLKTLVPRRPWMVLVRACIMFTAYTCYYLALAALPIASSVALNFTAPLFITILSVVALGETVGARRWTAVCLGFVGVLIMVHPGSELFDWAALFALAAGLAYAVSQIIARSIGSTETASAMSFYGNVVFFIAGALLSLVFGFGGFEGITHKSFAFLMRGWVTPSFVDLLLMMSCGVVAAAGMTLLTQAYRVTQANTVAPFEYTSLVWATLYGWLVWREIPSAEAWVGIAVIVAAGLYVLYREGQPGRGGPLRALRNARIERFRVRRSR